jgi:hypothetical protein
VRGKHTFIEKETNSETETQKLKDSSFGYGHYQWINEFIGMK